MKRPIILKIFFSFLLIILTGSGLTIFFTYETIRSYYITSITDSMVIRNSPLHDDVVSLLSENHSDNLSSVIKKYSTITQTRITIIDTNGKVLADSLVDPSSMYNHATRPEVISALQAKVGRSVRYSPDLKQEMIYIALPVMKEDKVIGVIRYSLKSEEITQLLNTLKWRIIMVSLVVAIISLLISILISHFLSRPLRELQKASKKVATGDFTVRVPTTGNDELKDLAESFNVMTEKLKDSFSEITRNKQELQSIISSITEGLLLFDKEGKILLCNESVHKITGIADINGKFYWEVLRSQFLNQMLGQKSQSLANDEITLNGRIFHCSASMLPSGEATVLLLYDITERKQVEQLKRDLAINVSHELRTPLTAIKGFTETLLDDADEKARQYLNIIMRHTDRLISMVKDLLILSEVEEKGTELHTERVNLKALIENLIIIFEPRIIEKNLRLKVDISQLISLKADAFRLEQLFTNLIDNAIKYTEKGEIIISAQESDGNIIIKIKDTGIGISTEHLSRIFERFYVADKSRSRSMGGTGLGLAIAKHIVSLHKGRIEVESTPYMGTTFTISLPRELGMNI